VEARGELHAKNYFGFKMPLVVPTIVCFHAVIAQGHIQGGAKRKGANANSETSLKREGEGRGYHKTCTRSRKVLCLIKR
jgi:hypothetical protein